MLHAIPDKSSSLMLHCPTDKMDGSTSDSSLPCADRKFSVEPPELFVGGSLSADNVSGGTTSACSAGRDDSASMN